MFSGINFFGWQMKLAAVLIALSAMFFWHKSEVRSAVAQNTAQIELQYAKEKFKLIDKAQAETFALRDQVDAITKDKNAKIKTLDARVATLTRSLSERPNRPSSNDSVPGSASNPESIQGATGVQLYRPDGEFLVWFAGNTTKLQVELNTCYNNYDTVKATLDKFKRENTPKTN